METDIHKALVHLEDNLSKLGAARQQVDTLAKGGQALTERTAVLLEDTAQLMELVKTDMQAIVKMLDARLEAAERHIDRMVEKGSTAVGETLEKMKQGIAETGHAVEKSVAELRAAAEGTLVRLAREQKEQLNGFQSEVDGKLDSALETFAASACKMRQTAEESVQRMAMISEEALTKQVREAEALLVQLKETNVSLRDLLSHFYELDLAAKWSVVANELKDFRLETVARLAAAEARAEALKKGQTYLLYALGGVVLLLLILKFV